ncbi:MAG: hypothetical protein SPD56_09050, partial [Alloprevotella sp.]|nr:hypothetical protein [Alloprevotella sp.]
DIPEPPPNLRREAKVSAIERGMARKTCFIDIPEPPPNLRREAKVSAIERGMARKTCFIDIPEPPPNLLGDSISRPLMNRLGLL